MAIAIESWSGLPLDSGSTVTMRGESAGMSKGSSSRICRPSSSALRVTDGMSLVRLRSRTGWGGLRGTPLSEQRAVPGGHEKVLTTFYSDGSVATPRQRGSCWAWADRG